MATLSSTVARRIPWTETSPAALHKLPAGAPCLDQTGKRGGWRGHGVRGTRQMISGIHGPIALTLLIIPLQISANRGQRSSTCPPSPEQVTIHPGGHQPCACPPTPPPSLCTLGGHTGCLDPGGDLGVRSWRSLSPTSAVAMVKSSLSQFERVPSSGLNKRCSGDTDAHKRLEARERGGLQ